jgi:cytochrome b561
MNHTDDIASYGATTRALHWLGALCVLLAWLLGSFGDDLPKATRPAALFAHISLGLAVLGLLVVRLGWRVADPPPASLPTSLGAWTNTIAAAVHWLLYALMIAVPVTGIVLQFARGDALPIFGLFDVASPWPRDRAFARSVKEVHELLANIILVAAALHAASALFHHYVLRDATLTRMLSRRNRI